MSHPSGIAGGSQRPPRALTGHHGCDTTTVRVLATLKLDSGAELRVEFDRDDLDLDRAEIVLRRVDRTELGECVEMSEQEKTRRLAALVDRMFDPDGFDREALRKLEMHEDDS